MMAKRTARHMRRIYGDMPDLMALPAEIRRLVMPEIVEKGAEIARKEAPKGRGSASSKSIVNRIRGLVDKSNPAVGFVRSYAPHSHLIEFGTKGHSLKGGSGKRKRNKAGWKRAMTINGSTDILRSNAWHPGSRANPYMQRTEEQLPGEVDQILVEGAYRAMDRTMTSVEKLIGGTS
jgi:hypothetical protein